MPYLKVLLLADNPLDLNEAFDGWQIKQSCMKFPVRTFLKNLHKNNKKPLILYLAN